MAHVQPVSRAGTVRDATAHVHLVSMVMAAKKGVHDAGTMNPVTQKLGCVRVVIPDGLDPGARAYFGETLATIHKNLHYLQLTALQSTLRVIIFHLFLVRFYTLT